MNLRVVSVTPDASVQVAIARMLEENVGSVAVCEGHDLVGIFTERDVLRLAGKGEGIGSLEIRDVMTRSPVTVSPDDDALAAAKLMGERRIRHLPVVQDGHLLGILGIRDVMRSLVERVWREHDPAARDTAQQLLRRAPGDGTR
ncbi:MAG: CBS domain-containing protein [Gaiellaceae bacterium]